MEAGRRQYKVDVELWHRMHGAEGFPTLEKPYPLRPETVVLESGECYSCGMVVEPLHVSTQCIAQDPLRPQELRWRQQVTGLMRRTASPMNRPSYLPASVQHIPTVWCIWNGWNDANIYSSTTGRVGRMEWTGSLGCARTRAQLDTGKLYGTTADIEPAVVPIVPSPPLIPLSNQTNSFTSHHTLQEVPRAQCIIHSISSSSSMASIELPSLNPPSPTGLVVPSFISDNSITDVYRLDALGKPAISQTSNLFLTVPYLQGPQGEKTQFLAIVDNGTMINAIDTAAYQHIARRLSPLSPSVRTLCMANRSLVLSTGVWTGTLSWGPVQVHMTFEVFPSRGSW